MSCSNHTFLLPQFCATGTMGLSGNMTAGEILEQVVHADRILAEEYEELKANHTGDKPLPKIELVRNIVFMGMGEVRSVWILFGFSTLESFCCSVSF